MSRTAQQEERYQAFDVVIAGPAYDPSLGGGAWRCWFHVTPLNDEWDEPFTFAITVTNLHARRSVDGRSAEQLAIEEGRAWAHGLIDLGRIERGALVEQSRTSDWPAPNQE